MTGKDDPTISCTNLMVKLSVLAGRKIILKGGGYPYVMSRMHALQTWDVCLRILTIETDW